jgi:hypothetical protein
MLIVDLLIAIIAPLFVPIFYHFLSTPIKPSVTRNSSAKKADYKKSVSIFMMELPTAYIGNAIWGMTYRINSGNYSIYWTIYCFIALFSCIPILCSRNIKKPILYQILILLFYLLLCVLSIIRIFYLTI